MRSTGVKGGWKVRVTVRLPLSMGQLTVTGEVPSWLVRASRSSLAPASLRVVLGGRRPVASKRSAYS